MGQEEKSQKRERRDWIIILVILLFGFLCVSLAGQWAIRFAPKWKLNTNMESNIDPNSDFLTNRPSDFIEPIDPAILTNAIWVNLYQTPNAIIPTNIIPLTSTPTVAASSTAVIISSSTNTVVPSPTSTNTVIYYPPPLPTNTKKPPPPTPTNTLVVNADLQITITDNSTDYAAGVWKIYPHDYVITVSNAGTSNVTGATVSNVFVNGNIDPSTVGWVCTSTPGAACALFGTGNLNNEPVDLNSGSSVTFRLGGQVIASPSGNLVNTATVTVPPGVTDPTPGNNSATDSDQLVMVNGPVDSTPDGAVTNYPANSSYTTLQFATPLVVGSGQYLVYYPEYPNPPADPTLQMDLVILQIGDGSNWYTVFNWGDGSQDGNVDFLSASPPNSTDCSSESDNCPIDISQLTVQAPYPGVTISIPAGVPAGNFPYIRILSPGTPPDSGDGVTVDAIQILP